MQRAPNTHPESAAAHPGHPPRARLAVLISGGGSTMVNIVRHSRDGRLNCEVGLVIASRPCAGVERATELGVPVVTMPGTIPAAELAAVLAAHWIGFVALAGYLRLLDLPPGLEGRAVNIHPALLPSFGGHGMHGLAVHRAVLEAGCKVSGCTVHFVDRQYDTGPIILQRACEVMETDTPETLAARVQREESIAYPEAIALLVAGRLRVEGRRVSVLPAGGVST